MQHIKKMYYSYTSLFIAMERNRLYSQDTVAEQNIRQIFWTLMKEGSSAMAEHVLVLIGLSSSWRANY